MLTSAPLSSISNRIITSISRESAILVKKKGLNETLEKSNTKQTKTSIKDDQARAKI